MQRISVFGLGYVGTVLTGCLAKEGHHVLGVDADPSKVELIRSGHAPIVEEGIQEMIRDGVARGSIEATTDADHAIAATGLSFVCVGTPSDAKGGPDLRAMRVVSEQIGSAIARRSEYHVVTVRSTLLPGTMEREIIPILRRAVGREPGDGYDVCYMPEFLREGTSIRDYYDPPFTVIAGTSPRGIDAVRALFESLPCPIITTTMSSAEALKFACNAFHAVKVIFANEIGRTLKARGMDAREVMELVCRDDKLNISRAYLSPGFAFGGSCLPKDVRAIISRAREDGVPVPLLESVMGSNQAHVDHAARLVLAERPRRVGMLGFSFKEGTDDLRESPLVTLADQLLHEGIPLLIHDPTVEVARLLGSNRRFIAERIPHLESLFEPDGERMLREADLVVVGMKGPTALGILERGLRSEQVVVDLVGIPSALRRRARYVGICW
ncbi:MAG: nucleotide sugar dehydrogenase [Hyphomicrobiales bacterium]